MHVALDVVRRSVIANMKKHHEHTRSPGIPRVPLTLEQRIDMRKKERIKKAPKPAVVNNGTVNHKKHPTKAWSLRHL